MFEKPNQVLGEDLDCPPACPTGHSRPNGSDGRSGGSRTISINLRPTD